MMKKFTTLAVVFLLVSWTFAQAQNKAGERDNDKDDQAKKAQKVKLTNGPVIEMLTDSKATIAWSTNDNASTILKYGTNPQDLDQTAEKPWGGHTHRVYLKNLKPGTTYYYRVESTEAQGSGSSVMSGTESFTTKSTASASTPASTPAQTQQTATPTYSQYELHNFDEFLDAHADIKAQLTQNPALVNDPTYLQQHPGLAQFLQTHQGVQAELRKNPSAFMQGETAYQGTENRDMALHNFHQFLVTHNDLKTQLTQNPALANDPNYLARHPQLAEFLRTHGGVRQNLQSDPAGFMQSETALR